MLPHVTKVIAGEPTLGRRNRLGRRTEYDRGVREVCHPVVHLAGRRIDIPHAARAFRAALHCSMAWLYSSSLCKLVVCLPSRNSCLAARIGPLWPVFCVLPDRISKAQRILNISVRKDIRYLILEVQPLGFEIVYASFLGLLEIQIQASIQNRDSQVEVMQIEAVRSHELYDIVLAIKRCSCCCTWHGSEHRPGAWGADKPNTKQHRRPETRGETTRGSARARPRKSQGGGVRSRRDIRTKCVRATSRGALPVIPKRYQQYMTKSASNANVCSRLENSMPMLQT